MTHDSAEQDDGRAPGRARPHDSPDRYCSPPPLWASHRAPQDTHVHQQEPSIQRSSSALHPGTARECSQRERDPTYDAPNPLENAPALCGYCRGLHTAAHHHEAVHLERSRSISPIRVPLMPPIHPCARSVSFVSSGNSKRSQASPREPRQTLPDTTTPRMPLSTTREGLSIRWDLPIDGQPGTILPTQVTTSREYLARLETLASEIMPDVVEGQRMDNKRGLK